MIRYCVNGKCDRNRLLYVVEAWQSENCRNCKHTTVVYRGEIN